MILRIIFRKEFSHPIRFVAVLLMFFLLLFVQLFRQPCVSQIGAVLKFSESMKDAS